MRVAVEGLAHRFEGTDLLFENLSFVAEPGVTIAICGPSGCGKSTLDILVEKLEYLLAHEAEEEDPDRDMEQIFVRILSDRTADYMQVSRELSELGWSGNHEYMCLILQITYLNQQNLSTKAICRYIKRNLRIL